MAHNLHIHKFDFITFMFYRGDNKPQPTCQIWPASDFVNKVSLEHSLTHSFMYYLWLLLLYINRVT